MMMKKITDYSEISPLVMKYFKRGVVTNNFLTKNDYVSEIAEEKLFVSSNENELVFYIKREGFYSVFFHTLNGTLTLDETKENLICEASGDAEKLLQDTAFGEKILDRVYYENDCAKKDLLKSTNVSFAEESDAEEVFELMNKSFDKETGFVPTLTQIKREIAEKLVYKAIKDGKIAGVIRRQLYGKNSRIRHLCVSEDFRGQRVGESLCSFFLNESEKATVWTGKENTAARRLYERMDFELSDITAAVYKREGKNDKQRQSL